MAKKRKAGPSGAGRKVEPSAISADDIKSRIVRAVDEAISGSSRAVRMNGGSYTRSDTNGTYTRPDRSLSRG
jgi:hypothetical protein